MDLLGVMVRAFQFVAGTRASLCMASGKEPTTADFSLTHSLVQQTSFAYFTLNLVIMHAMLPFMPTITIIA